MTYTKENNLENVTLNKISHYYCDYVKNVLEANILIFFLSLCSVSECLEISMKYLKFLSILMVIHSNMEAHFVFIWGRSLLKLESFMRGMNNGP